MTQPDPPAFGPDRRLDLTSQQQLPCGASVDEVIEQAADGHADELTPHQSGCQYCQAALLDSAAQWAPVARAVTVPVVVPVGLAASVMAAVMAHTTGAPTSGVGASAGGRGRIPHLGHWISAVLGVVAIAVVLTVIGRSTTTKPKTPETVPAATVSTTPPSPVTTNRSAPRSAATPTPPKPIPSTTRSTRPSPTALPTAVPAGTGGRAATAGADTRDQQEVLFGAGVMLTGVSGLYLTRVSRRRKSNR